MMSSLSVRLLVAVSLLLVVFFGATVAVLDVAFRNTAERAAEDRLDGQLFLLMAEAEPGPTGVLQLPDDLPEPRFASPGSGLYGQVADAAGTPLWRSPSAVGMRLPTPSDLAPGERRFARTTLAPDTAVFLRTLRLEWELADGSLRGYHFSAAESMAPFHAQVQRFRRQLLTWFGLLAAVLVVCQGVLLRWVLRPLRRIEAEIGEVESGERSELGEGYPTELRGVAANTNRLISAERKRLARYRNTLGNLAHSLKTPLAVIRTAMNGGGVRDGRMVIEEQLDRMDDMVGYQLQHAAASGGATLGHQPLAVDTVVDRLIASLQKVYADKRPAVERSVERGARFFGDEGDLMEMLGNLLDNACKFCRTRVRVGAAQRSADRGRRPGLWLAVEDDGDGIAAADAERVLRRGVRVDEQVDGHGIGLAIVKEIVELYDGTLTIDASPLGGARITVEIPPA